MRKTFKASFVSLSFGWLLLLTGCQDDINVVHEDAHNLHRGTEVNDEKIILENHEFK